MNDDEKQRLTGTYFAVKRKPVDWSLAEAIRHHAQACGVVAHIYDLHPDRVAEAVADRPAIAAESAAHQRHDQTAAP